MTSSGCDALDFHMAFYLGELANKEPSSFFYMLILERLVIEKILTHLGLAPGATIAPTTPPRHLPAA